MEDITNILHTKKNNNINLIHSGISKITAFLYDLETVLTFFTSEFFSFFHYTHFVRSFSRRFFFLAEKEDVISIQLRER